MKSILKLFKALPVTKKGKKKATKSLLKETIKKGFIFSPEVVYNYSEKNLLELTEEIGLSAKQMNSSFHKSWKKVKNATIEQLVIEQIIHYLTTYGAESFGIYNSDLVYIPDEELKIPKLKKDKISLVIIKGYTKEEIKEKLFSLLQSGIALSEDTIKDVIDIATFVKINEKDITSIRNKEVKVALYDYLDLFPENPIEFLRYMVYKSINKTLLIKDKKTIDEIKTKDNLYILNLLKKYRDKYGLQKLAEIFYRFKPIFLAFRTVKGLKKIINKIRKLAVKYHKPMKEDYLNTVTAKIGKIKEKELVRELTKVNIFRKIRLAYALKFRTKDVESILYKIRNGKTYATEFSFNNKKEAVRILNIVLKSIIKDIKKNVNGKKIYIPNHIIYTLPATEKQFTGNFPSGTCVSIPKDMIFGVHWKNVDGHRVDLDLSLINADEGKLGWDGYYRTENRDVLFSGDVTDAPKPKGASELFYVKKQKEQSFILFVNYYNHNEKIEVPFNILVAKEQVRDLKANYTINPNNVVAITQSKINQKQKVLGLLMTTLNEAKFYFAESYLGNSITSSNSKLAKNGRQYLVNFYNNTISLNDILKKSGAKIVTNKKKADIDLSPETIEKDSILNLIKK